MNRFKDQWESLTRFLREVRGELRKVIWPGRKQTFMLTSVVVVSSILVGILIYVADAAISSIVEMFVK